MDCPLIKLTISLVSVSVSLVPWALVSPPRPPLNPPRPRPPPSYHQHHLIYVICIYVINSPYPSYPLPYPWFHELWSPPPHPPLNHSHTQWSQLHSVVTEALVKVTQALSHCVPSSHLPVFHPPIYICCSHSSSLVTVTLCGHRGSGHSHTGTGHSHTATVHTGHSYTQWSQLHSVVTEALVTVTQALSHCVPFSHLPVFHPPIYICCSHSHTGTVTVTLSQFTRSSHRGSGYNHTGTATGHTVFHHPMYLCSILPCAQFLTMIGHSGTGYKALANGHPVTVQPCTVQPYSVHS